MFSEEFTGDASAFFRACADHQLEGIVSKLASSKYRSGRKTWLKTKCFAESSFVIIGTARDRKTKAPLALLAHADAQGLTYAGSEKCSGVSSELFTEQKWVFIRKKLFQFSPPLRQRSVAEVSAIQMEKVEGAEN